MAINKEIICFAAFVVVGIILMCILSTRTEGMVKPALKPALKKMGKSNYQNKERYQSVKKMGGPMGKSKYQKKERYQSATGSSCGKN